MSWLKALSALIESGKYNGRKLGALGETFIRASEDNPDYFVVKGPMTADVAELSRKHGLGLKASTLPGAGGRGPKDYLGVVDERDPNTASLYATSNGTLGSHLDVMKGKHWERDNYEALQNAWVNGGLDLETPLYYIDSMGSDRNTGVAKKGYPALWEYILAKGAGNITSTLSDSNTRRRSANMAGALEKWSDAAGERLLINKEQLGPMGLASRQVEYGDLATPEKIGLLNAWTAAHTDDALQKLMAYVPEERRGALGMAYPMDLTGLRSEAEFAQLADALREGSRRQKLAIELAQASGEGFNLSALGAPGIDSLRRAAIVAEQLKGPGLKPLDLRDRPWLTKHLARKDGGRV